MSHFVNRLSIFVLLLLSALTISAAIPADGELFHIDGPNGKIAARLHLPSAARNGKKSPMVILSHGFGGNMESPLWHKIDSMLVGNGIGVVRFDFNGHGLSDGKFRDMTVPREIDDLKAVIAYTRALPSTGTIALAGHSQGGVVTSMTAGELGSDSIAGAVLLAPAAVLRDDCLRGNTMGCMYDPWNLDQEYYKLPWGGMELGREYIATGRDLPIYETSAKYTGPVMVIHGMADRVVPYTYGVLYERLLPNASTELLPGEDHGFSRDTNRAATLTANWLIKLLKK